MHFLPRERVHKLWVQGLVILSLALLSACNTATPEPPTITPRPTLEPRTPPTALPTPVQLGEVEAGIPTQVTLPGGTYVEFVYVLEEAQIVSIQAVALSQDSDGNPLDPVIEVLDADNNRVAYDDDAGRENETLGDQDAVISNLQLEPGTYTIRVNAFNGFQDGEIEVFISAEG